MFPTSPDTLRAFPFIDEDPFVIMDAPHVYFAGNQPTYCTKLIKNEEENEATRVICVPSFRRTKSVVLLDLDTLQSYEYKFDCAMICNMTKTDELEFKKDNADEDEKNLVIAES